jgi:MauM/NapG family ferredoxin protein
MRFDEFFKNPDAVNRSDSPPLDRQDFLRQGMRWLMGQVADQVESAVKPLTQRKLLRPPGAQPEPLFLAMCTRCDACTAACPHEAIAVHYGAGAPHDGTPYLWNLSQSPCLLCEDMPCIAACPTEALLPTQPAEVRIGEAVLDTLTCTAFRGSGCKTCYDVCPFPDQAIEIRENLPFVLPDACTGCGICQHHCPTDPKSIVVMPT